MPIMDEPLVSLITPCFNGEKFISRYLESVLNQAYKNLELFLIDDGSTDDTKKIIDLYKNRLDRRGIKNWYIYQKK